jgi:DNA (cytosine-5)-methyltransferase 1
VIAFFAVFKSIVSEVSRYKDCYLRELGSHTASDLTSKTAGDIEIFNSNKKLIEAIEIKHNKIIDINVVRVAVEKIHKFNPARYCIFSFNGIKKEDFEEIAKIIKSVETEHGCQIIVNGIISTLKYYLRLISRISDFIENYRILVEQDKELKKIHKDKLVELLE